MKNMKCSFRGRRGHPGFDPNFFVGMRITNTEVVSNILELQKQLTELELAKPWCGLTNTSILRDTMVPRERFYLVLNTKLIQNPDEAFKARTILNMLGKDLKREFMWESMELSFKGVGTSGGDRDSVIFARVEKKEEVELLSKLHHYLEKRFNEVLGHPIDTTPFHPHLKIMEVKDSKRLSEKKICSFPPGITDDLEDFQFGMQRIHNIELLRIGMRNPKTGRYISYGDFTF